LKAGSLLALLVATAVGAWILLDLGRVRDGLTVTNAQIHQIEAGIAGAFATIENTGPPDRLVAVSSPAAEAELYNPARGRGLPVPTGAVSLALDAAHVRLAGEFADGALVPLTLTFARAGNLTLKARLSNPQATGAAEEVGLFGMGDICRVGEGEPAPEISLALTPDGDGWTVTIEARDFEFSEEMAGGVHVPGMGHGHLYVGGMKMGRLYAPAAHVGALPDGRHEVRVTLNTNDHRAYVVGDEPVTATAVIVVD
jgi:periplasmic copper chaperone A